MIDQKIYTPLKDVEYVISILNKIAIFGGLTEKQLFEVFKLLKKVDYASGEYVYKQGDAASYIYIIKKGEVKLSVDNGHDSYELISYSAGDCFGETSVIGIQSHSSSALAVTDTELIILEHGSLLSLFERDKELFGMLILNIAREMSRRLNKSDEILAQYLLKNGR